MYKDHTRGRYWFTETATVKIFTPISCYDGWLRVFSTLAATFASTIKTHLDGKPWLNERSQFSVDRFFPDLNRLHPRDYHFYFRLFNVPISPISRRIPISHRIDDLSKIHNWCEIMKDSTDYFNEFEEKDREKRIKCFEGWFRVLLALAKFCFFWSIENHFSKHPGEQYRLDSELPFDPYETSLDDDLWEVRGTILAQTILKKAHEMKSDLPIYAVVEFDDKDTTILIFNLLLYDIIWNIRQYYEYFYTEKKINDTVLPDITLNELKALYYAAFTIIKQARPLHFERFRIMQSLKEYFINIVRRDKSSMYYSFRHFLHVRTLC